MQHTGIGDAVPDATFMHCDSEGVARLSSSDLFSGKNVLVIGVVGAFTPVCQKAHLPEYIPFQAQLKAAGLIDTFACISAADPFAMKAWSDHLEITGDVLMLTDPDAAFAEALGLAIDLSELGLGRRSTRYAMRVNNGVIDILSVELDPYDVLATSAGAMRKLIMGED